MKIIKTLVLTSLFAALAGCGSDAIEGKFNVQASVMGFKSNVGTAELDEDYITLLGMRCPDDDLIYTGYIDGADIVNNLEPKHIAYLREPHFYTVFDVFSRDMNKQLSTSEKHPILSNLHSIRFLDTMTCVAEEAPLEARDAFIAFKSAMTRSQCKRHRILTGDLLTFANQDGLHNREKIDILNPESAAARWLLKTYAFKDSRTAESYEAYWANNRAGCVID